MESVDTLEATTELVFDLLDEPELRDGPVHGDRACRPTCASRATSSSGCSTGAARGERRPPLVVRLVKGAYWDHEVVEARQHGWTPPVWEEKADSDRSFEALTAHAGRRRASTSGPRSPPTTSARWRTPSPTTGAPAAPTRDLELQVLRGLGDELAAALARHDLRVRIYCPVGDMVAGMAYLVRRLLENTSNESFLGDQQRGVPIDELLAAP